MFLGNANILRGSVSINHGASIAGSARSDFTASFTNAQLGDRVVASPAVVNPNAAVAQVESPAVTTAGEITVPLINLGTATTTAGTAVTYNITLIKNTGEDNVP